MRTADISEMKFNYDKLFVYMLVKQGPLA